MSGSSGSDRDLFGQVSMGKGQEKKRPRFIIECQYSHDAAETLHLNELVINRRWVAAPEQTGHDKAEIDRAFHRDLSHAWQSSVSLEHGKKLLNRRNTEYIPSFISTRSTSERDCVEGEYGPGRYRSPPP